MFREGSNGGEGEGEERLETWRRGDDMRRWHVLPRGMMPSSFRLPSARSRSHGTRRKQAAATAATLTQLRKVESWRLGLGVSSGVRLHCRADR